MEKKQQTFAVVAVLFAAFALLLAKRWGGMGEPLLTLILAVGTVFGLLAAGYALVRYLSPRISQSSEESTIERFRQLDGLFRSISIEVRESAECAAFSEEFRAQRARLEALVDPVTRNFKPEASDAPDLVHNLTLVYLRLVPAVDLCQRIDSLRAAYGHIAGPEAYEKYLVSPAHTAAAESQDHSTQIQLLRADAICLTSETRRLALLKAHGQATRQRLINTAFASWWANVVPMFAILVFYLFCQTCADHAEKVRPSAPDQARPPDWAAQFADAYLINERKLPVPINTKADVIAEPTPHTAFFQTLLAGALLALAAIAGASGGMISVVQRVQSGGSGDPGTDLRTLSQSEGSVFFAPVTGAIFAVVLSTLLAGRFVSGTIFPDTQNLAAWYFVLWSPAELAKWVLWGFLAGFSERMVPDMLNNIAKKITDPNAGNPPEGAREATAAVVSALPSEAADESDETAAGEPPVAPPFFDEDDGTNVIPELNAHAGSIPPEATEVTVTGKGFTARTDVFVNGQARERSALLEVTGTSLRIALQPEDLEGRTEIVIVAVNPQPGGDESHPLTIPLAPMGN